MKQPEIFPRETRQLIEKMVNTLIQKYKFKSPKSCMVVAVSSAIGAPMPKEFRQYRVTDIKNRYTGLFTKALHAALKSSDVEQGNKVVDELSFATVFQLEQKQTQDILRMARRTTSTFGLKARSVELIPKKTTVSNIRKMLEQSEGAIIFGHTADNMPHAAHVVKKDGEFIDVGNNIPIVLKGNKGKNFVLEIRRKK